MRQRVIIGHYGLWILALAMLAWMAASIVWASPGPEIQKPGDLHPARRTIGGVLLIVGIAGHFATNRLFGPGARFKFSSAWSVNSFLILRLGSLTLILLGTFAIFVAWWTRGEAGRAEAWIAVAIGLLALFICLRLPDPPEGTPQTD